MSDTSISYVKPVTNETMIPTMSFRWFVPSFLPRALAYQGKRLQQLHHTSRGSQWIDIPMFEESPVASVEIAHD